MTDAMETYIATQNIARFKAQLREETHPDKRRILLQLLANEVAKHPDSVERAETIRDQSTFDDLIIFSSVRLKQGPFGPPTTLDDMGPSSAAFDGPFFCFGWPKPRRSLGRFVQLISVVGTNAKCRPHRAMSEFGGETDDIYSG